MSKPSPRDPLATVDLAALEKVTGGTAAGSSSSSQLLSQLTGILDSIKSISTNHPQGFNQQEMLMFMVTMLQKRDQQQSPAVPWAPGGGYWVY